MAGQLAVVAITLCCCLCMVGGLVLYATWIKAHIDAERRRP